MHDTMRSLVLRSVPALALAALLAAPAGAQDHRYAVGFVGGWSEPSDLTPGMATSTTLEPGWIAGLQLERWPGSARVGFRLGGSYADRAVVEDPASRYMVGTADLSLMVRLLSAGRPRWVAPYVTLGGGASMYKAMDTAGPVAGGAYGDDPATRALVLAGGGFDLLPSGSFGLRLEAIDRIILPSIGEGPESVGLPMAHGPEFSAALQIRGGAARRPTYVAAVPVPAAPAAQRAAPQPAQPQPQPAATPAQDPEAAALRGRIEQWQRDLGVLSERVDSLERAVVQARLDAAETERRLMAAASAAGTAPAAAVAAPQATRAASSATASNAPVAGPLFTVQVGAFVEEETAHRWADRLRRKNLPVWVTPAVVKGMRVSRVRVGALPSLAEAENLGRMLSQDYGWPVWVDRVGNIEAVTADAVAASRSFLRGN